MTIEFFLGGNEDRREDLRVFNRGCDRVLDGLGSFSRILDNVSTRVDDVSRRLDDVSTRVDDVSKGCDRVLDDLKSFRDELDSSSDRIHSILTDWKASVMKDMEPIIKNYLATKPATCLTRQKHNCNRFRCRRAPKNHSYRRQQHRRRYGQ